MKTTFMILCLLISSLSFANHGEQLLFTEELIKGEVINKTKYSNEIECSVTSSGVIHSAEYGDIPMTITVTGPCDSSLAQIMRDKIAEIREKFGDTTGNY